MKQIVCNSFFKGMKNSPKFSRAKEMKLIQNGSRKLDTTVR